MRRKKIQGFTFVELIVVVAVAAILMGTAVPSFTSLMNSNRLATQANDLLGAIMIARSEANGNCSPSITFRRVPAKSG